MGLFDIILKGLGFGDEQELDVQQEVQSQKPVSGKMKFDLTKQEESDDIVLPQKKAPNPEERPFSLPTQPPATSLRDYLVLSPKNQTEIWQVVEQLRKREPIMVNFAALSVRDAERALDFLSGAIYAMRGKVEQHGATMFLFTPPSK